MKSSSQFLHFFSNYYVVIFMILLLMILIRKALLLIFGKDSEQDIFNFNQMGEADRKLYMITQINTKINKFFVDQSEHYANTFFQEIYGSAYKFPEPLPRKKEKRTDIHVTFSPQPIILNECLEEVVEN